MKMIRMGVFAAVSLAILSACTTSKKEEPTPTPQPALEQPPVVNEPAPTPMAEAPAPLTAPAPAVADVYTETIYFDFDSAALTPAAQETLRKIAASLISNQAQNIKIQIEGHCDERGTEEYNLALGERRAKAAAEFLKAQGVPASMLSTISYGELRPAVQGSGEEAWSKNRRAEFVKLQ